MPPEVRKSAQVGAALEQCTPTDWRFTLNGT
jgi:hypothetical protein